MSEIINKKVIFHCISCGRTFSRPAKGSDYCGKVAMPVGWGYIRILWDFKYFCDNSVCQKILDQCAIDYKIDHIPTNVEKELIPQKP